MLQLFCGYNLWSHVRLFYVINILYFLLALSEVFIIIIVIIIIIIIMIRVSETVFKLGVAFTKRQLAFTNTLSDQVRQHVGVLRFISVGIQKKSRLNFS
jgi:hypothetical protein